MTTTDLSSPSVEQLTAFSNGTFRTILADPPWRFNNRTGRVAPEYRRRHRYQSLPFDEIVRLPVNGLSSEQGHLYLWVPNALLREGLEVMEHWGFEYKTNLVWHKVRKDGGPDGRGVGFYFRNVTELSSLGYAEPSVPLKPAAVSSLGYAEPSEHNANTETGTLTEARRTLRHYRAMQSGTIPGIVRPAQPQGLGSMGG